MVIYSGFIVDLLVDLPIENDDLMGFYWDTLWLFNSLPWKIAHLVRWFTY